MTPVPRFPSYLRVLWTAGCVGYRLMCGEKSRIPASIPEGFHFIPQSSGALPVYTTTCISVSTDTKAYLS